MKLSFKIKNLEKEMEILSETTQKRVTANLLKVYILTIKRTPVDTGRARNNWFTRMGAAKTGGLERDGKRGGGDAVQESREVLSKYTLGQNVFFSNNVPYIRRLEFGSWSGQAPNGMLRRSIEDVVSR